MTVQANNDILRINQCSMTLKLCQIASGYMKPNRQSTKISNYDNQAGRCRLAVDALSPLSDLQKNFLFSVLSDLSVFMTTIPIYYSQVSFLTQPSLVMVVLTAHTNRLKKDYVKILLYLNS